MGTVTLFISNAVGIEKDKVTVPIIDVARPIGSGNTFRSMGCP